MTIKYFIDSVIIEYKKDKIKFWSYTLISISLGIISAYTSHYAIIKLTNL